MTANIISDDVCTWVYMYGINMEQISIVLVSELIYTLHTRLWFPITANRMPLSYQMTQTYNYISIL